MHNFEYFNLNEKKRQEKNLSLLNKWLFF